MNYFAVRRGSRKGRRRSRVSIEKEPGGRFRAWLYRIARDRVYRSLRRKGVAMQSLDDVEIEHPVSDEPIDTAVLRDSLRDLPHEQREVLLLRFVEEMSYEQIAAAVGCELG